MVRIRKSEPFRNRFGIPVMPMSEELTKFRSIVSRTIAILNRNCMLSKKCQYALHALIYLADLDEGTSVTIGEIAREKAIPKKFLEAILLDLKNAGILGSKKGKSGGYYLIKEPDQIPIIEVIRHIDGAVAMLPCVSLNFYDTCGMCEDEKTCRINHLFGQVRDATLKILTTNSVADLANTNKPGIKIGTLKRG